MPPMKESECKTFLISGRKNRRTILLSLWHFFFSSSSSEHFRADVFFFLLENVPCERERIEAASSRDTESAFMRNAIPALAADVFQQELRFFWHRLSFLDKKEIGAAGSVWIVGISYGGGEKTCSLMAYLSA